MSEPTRPEFPKPESQTGQYPPSNYPPPDASGNYPPPPEYPPVGYPPPTDVPPPAGPPSRGRFAALLAAIAVVAVGVGIAIGVAVASGDDSSTASPPGTPSSINSGSPASGNTAQQQGNGKKGKKGKKKGKKQGQNGAGKATRGTITAESGPTWTVKTQQGQSIKVTISSTTKFGTQKAPTDKSSFPVGTKIAVVGKTASGAVTAVRVRPAP